MESASSSSSNTDMEIHVRTLTGESTAIRISPNKTIHELKLLLKLSFPPASSSPSFHLFFKGAKLDLRSTISCLSIEDGEFFVMVPFTKKERPETQKPNFTERPQNLRKQTSISSFADSAYSDMMQEFQSLTEDGGKDSDKGVDKERSFSHSVEKKRKRVDDCGNQVGGPYEFLWSVFISPENDAFGGQNSQKIVEVLESVSCLSSPQSGRCLLREANMHCGDGALQRDTGNPCSCPVWLKKIMEAFTFLSLFNGFLQLGSKKITLSRLNGVLNQLGEFGVQVGIKDVEHLALICPKVVRFANNDTANMGFSEAIVIIDSSEKEKDEVEEHSRKGQKGMSLTKIFSAMKKRESSFKTNLWEAVKLLTKSKNGRTIIFCLEDLLNFVKEGGTVIRGNEAKRARGSKFSRSSSRSVQYRCHRTDELQPLEMIEHLRNGTGSKGQMVHVEDIDARKAIYKEMPERLSDKTKSVLKNVGIDKFYIHQTESIMASLAGKNVVVATMTSSGKSLCYNVPVLEELSQNLSSCALYLFPTKALAQDQLRALLAMTKQFDSSINIGVYDGDTSYRDRMWLRDNARVLITNPDMLHMSILPFHGQFSRILSNIRYLVIDEAHAYKGAFGCHTALILRRFRRLCSHVYGSDPSFIFCTATSANPREHCMELANLSELELIENDGSPSSQKLFVLWNPFSCLKSVWDGTQNDMDASDTAACRNSSPISEVSYLFAEMVQHGLRCIAFCRSRKLCELVLCYAREILEKTAPHLVDSISAYRGGYVAEDRRRIESDLFGGKLCGIAATNALELGIDVGHIDVTLHLGFPGSIASFWQQAGRSGRREKPSLAVYVAFGGPLDQYFMRCPRKLFSSPIECCHIDAQNQQVVEQHLVCAALEHPLSLQYDEKYFGPGLNSAIMNLTKRGYVNCDPSRDSSARIWSYIGQEKMPSHAVSIRAIEAVRYKVIDIHKDDVLEEIEESKAFFQVYEGAVYMHQGKTYLVKDLDTKGKIALCQRANMEYYTKTRDYTDIHVVGGNIAYPLKLSKNPLSRTTAQAQTCNVTTTWFGFHRIRKGSNEIFDTIELSLPKYSYESQAVWIQVSQSIKTAVEKNFSFRSGLHAASHALLHVVPLYIRCNYSDLSPECPNPHETRFFPARILLYDQHPGGTGVSIQIQPYFTELLEAALELLTSCHCSGETGCPNCVQSLACHEYNELIDKDAAIVIIQGVLESERSYFRELPNN